MDYRDERRRLIEGLINDKVTKEEFEKYAEASRVGAPLEMLKRWKRRFYAPAEFDYPRDPRLMNRFMMGADPEFIFMAGRGMDANYVYAQDLGLNTIEAFGCDMSGRQAELRLKPSRFVLDIVASAIDTFRWMHEAKPTIGKYQWLASAFIERDGIGGHVHFGRKRPDTKAAVKSLDNLMHLLCATGSLDAYGHENRIKQTKYGRDGDIRVQPHGYEYRSFPTWLASPWAAYLTLTLSKLCVFHHLEYRKTRKILDDYVLVNNLLQAYQAVDDDARIALIAFTKFGLPKWANADFKGTWGIQQYQTFKDLSNKRIYYPPEIEASGDTKLELFSYLTKGVPIPTRAPKITWDPFQVGNDIFYPIFESHRAGLPEVAQGILSKKLPIQLILGRINNRFDIEYPQDFPFDAIAAKKRFNEMNLSIKFGVAGILGAGAALRIHTPANIQHDFVVDKDIVTDIKRVLLDSGLFPVAKYTEIKDLDPAPYWVDKKKDLPLIGKVISQTVGNEGG